MDPVQPDAAGTNSGVSPLARVLDHTPAKVKTPQRSSASFSLWIGQLKPWLFFNGMALLKAVTAQQWRGGPRSVNPSVTKNSAYWNRTALLNVLHSIADLAKDCIFFKGMEIFTFLQSELGASLTKYLGDDIRIHQGSSSQELTPPSGTVDEEHLFWILWWSSWGIPEVISYLSGSWLKEFTLMILDYPTGMPVISGAYEAYDNFSTFYRHHRITNHQSITTSAGLCRATPAMRTTASSTNQLVKMIAGTDGDLKILNLGKRTRVEVCWGIKTCSFRSDFTGVSLKPKLWSSFQVCDFRLNFLLAAAVGFGCHGVPFHWETLHASPGFSPRNISATRRHIPARSWLQLVAAFFVLRHTRMLLLGSSLMGWKNQHDTVYIYSVYI